MFGSSARKRKSEDAILDAENINNGTTDNSNDEDDHDGNDDEDHNNGFADTDSNQHNDNGSSDSSDEDEYDYDDDDDDDISRDSMDDNVPLRRAICKQKPEREILHLIGLYPNDVQQTNSYGYYPLHLACENDDHPNVVLRLIDLYPLAAQRKTTTEGEYPLHRALTFHKSECVIMKLIDTYPMTVRKGDNDGFYPIHIALHRTIDQSDNIILKLIEIFKKAVKVPVRENRKLALHLALSCRKSSEELISKLIEIYPKALQSKDIDGLYPIDCAFDTNQSVGIFKLLIEADSLAMQRKNILSDNYPLHAACRNNSIDLVEYMVQHHAGICINMNDPNCGGTPLHVACEHCHDEVVAKLLQSPDINVNACAYLDETPLHRVAQSAMSSFAQLSNFVRVIQLLLNHPFIIINKRNRNNMTPLDSINESLKSLEEDNPRISMRGVRIRLPLLKKMKQLLEALTTKRRWDAYQYFLSTIAAERSCQFGRDAVMKRDT